MQTNDKKEELNVYRVGRMTVLELMGSLAILGVIVTWALRHFFAP